MRHCIKAAQHLDWWQIFFEIMCASLGRAMQYQSPCILRVDGRLHDTAKWKRSFLGKYLNDLHVPWRHKMQKMMAIAGILLVAKWLAKIKQRSNVSCRLCKRAREKRGASTEICRERHMGTSRVPSAMEWRQPSQLPTTSSGDIYMPACKLPKHQRVSSGLSHLIKIVVWTRCVCCFVFIKPILGNRYGPGVIP